MTEDADKPAEEAKRTYPAKVVALPAAGGFKDNKRVAINRGSEDGVREGQRFLVYALSEQPITDPDSGESLGRLEVVKGTGKVVHVQPRIATIESDRRSTTTRKVKELFAVNRTEVQESEIEPFESPAIGDLAKPV